jgi:hypothetical protein
MLLQKIILMMLPKLVLVAPANAQELLMTAKKFKILGSAKL